MLVIGVSAQRWAVSLDRRHGGGWARVGLGMVPLQRLYTPTTVTLLGALPDMSRRHSRAMRRDVPAMCLDKAKRQAGGLTHRYLDTAGHPRTKRHLPKICGRASAGHGGA
jgi:hypothetical protein